MEFVKVFRSVRGVTAADDFDVVKGVGIAPPEVDAGNGVETGSEVLEMLLIFGAITQ